MYRTVAYYNLHDRINALRSGPKILKEEADELLNTLLRLPNFTGGHLEEYVEGIGWIRETDPNDLTCIFNGDIDLVDLPA